MKKKVAPFPQANNIELIYRIFCSITDSGISKFDIVNEYHLHDRQGAYYLDALRFLNVVEKINTKYFIRSEVIEQLGNCSTVSRQSFCKLILREPFIRSTYNDLKDVNSENDIKKYISARIREEYNLGAGTSERRASSIFNWFVWINKYMDGEIGER